MKPTRAPLALLLLAACGDTTAPVRACDRIGELGCTRVSQSKCL